MMKLYIGVPEEVIQDLENRMSKVYGKTASGVLKTAVNNTAKQVQQALAEKASKEYAGKAAQKRNILNSSFIKKGTAHTPDATIEFHSPVHEIKDFHVSNLTVSRTAYRKDGKRRKKTIKGNVLSGTPKTLNEAFVVKFKSGHIAVVSRIPEVNADQYRSKPIKPHYEKLRQWFSPSHAVMVGGDRVYGAIHEDLQDMLLQQVHQVMTKALGE